MNITVQNFFSSTLNTVDAVIGHFVSNAYVELMQENAGMITLAFTFYVMFIGYQFLTHTHHLHIMTIIKQMIVMLCVYALLMNWKLYQLFVYDIFTIEPENIAKTLIQSAHQYQLGGNITRVMDGIFESIITATTNLFGQISFSISGMAFIVYGMLVFIIGLLLCIFTLLLFIYAKMMMAVVLALGPIFILFILWEPTKDLFAGWLRQLITIALIPIVTSGILALMLSVIDVTLPGINKATEELQFYGIAPFLGLALATVLILSQVFRICASLGGGITLVSLSAGGAIANSTLQKSGLAAAGRFVGRWSQNQVKHMRDRMLRNRNVTH